MTVARGVKSRNGVAGNAAVQATKATMANATRMSQSLKGGVPASALLV